MRRNIEHAYEFEGMLLHETKMAYLVADGDNEIWLPKSLCQDVDIKADMITLTISQRLAEEKGLV